MIELHHQIQYHCTDDNSMSQEEKKRMIHKQPIEVGECGGLLLCQIETWQHRRFTPKCLGSLEEMCSWMLRGLTLTEQALTRSKFRSPDVKLLSDSKLGWNEMASMAKNFETWFCDIHGIKPTYVATLGWRLIHELTKKGTGRLELSSSTSTLNIRTRDMAKQQISVDLTWNWRLLQ